MGGFNTIKSTVFKSLKAYSPCSLFALFYSIDNSIYNQKDN